MANQYSPPNLPVAIEGVHAYIDGDGTVMLKLRDCAIGLGLTHTNIINGIEYNNVRWYRVRKYLRQIKFLPAVTTDEWLKECFIPEPYFYLLAMKLKNPIAIAFQEKIAREILPAVRQRNMLSKILRNPAMIAEALGITNFEPNKKCAYVLEMDNGTVKIGITQDFDRRINEVMNNSGMNVVRHFHTEHLKKTDAFRAEAACHKTFADNRKRGEFFTVDFDDACNEVKRTIVIEVIKGGEDDA